MKKGIKIFIIAIAAVLSVLPFISRLFTAFGLTVLDTDRLIVQLVFVFACIAGIVTSLEKKQLNIEALADVLSEKTKSIVAKVISGISIAVLTMLFFACFPNYNLIDPLDTVFKIPVIVFYSFLPIMYIGILIVEFKRGECWIAKALGLILGLLLSSGSILSILDIFLGASFENLQELSIYTGLNSIFEFWLDSAHIMIWPMVILFLVAALFGMPLYIVLSGIAYFAFMTDGGYTESVPMEAYQILTDTSIAAIPLFTMAGYILAKGTATTRLLNFIKYSVGWLKGGVVITTILVATFFTTFTGASGVTILALGGILSMILKGSGYTEDDAEALITASGSIGILLPPSLAIIIYGATNFLTVNIFDLFKGGILPGILFAVSMMIMGIFKQDKNARVKFSKADLWQSFKDGSLELLLPLLIILTYFSGFFNLFETAAFAVIFAFALQVFIRKDCTLKESVRTIKESIPVAGGVLVIIGSAKALALFLVYAGIPDMLSEFVLAHVSSKYVFLLLLNILLLLVGCIMDIYSAILVVSPLIIPIAESFGIHPVHTGVIFLTNLALGFLTPPIGMNLFIAGYTFKKPVTKIIKNILPYLLVQFVILLLITYIPWFSTAFVN